MKRSVRNVRARRSARSMHRTSCIHNIFSQISSSCFTVRKPVGKHGYLVSVSGQEESQSQALSQNRLQTRPQLHHSSVGSETLIQDIPVVVATGNRGVEHVADSATSVSVELNEALQQKLEEVAPLSRKAIRQAQRAAQRKTYFLTSASLAALVSSAVAPFVFSQTENTSTIPLAQTEISSHVTPLSPSAASRSAERSSLRDQLTKKQSQQGSASEKHWTLDGATSNIDVQQVTGVIYPNDPAVSNGANSLSTGADKSAVSKYIPNHPTGDVGNAYEFSQCTWWVYVRRHQLGLPVGSHMGNGNQWANSARSLGYWVDNTARHVGDILVFAAGQYNSDPLYGHVAIVEKINPDGSVVTSECGAVMAGRTYSRTFTAAQVKTLQVIHY